jgi:anti-sigma factor RsiW
MKDKIVDYVLGALSADEAQAVKHHVDACPACRRYLRDIESHNEGLIACGQEVKADMVARCDRALEALKDVVPAEARGPRIVTFLGRLALTAVAAVLVLSAGIAIGRVTAPRPVDIGQLRSEVEASVIASLTPAVQETMLAQVDQRLDKALSANNTQLTTEIAAQVREDLRLVTTELMSGTQSLVDRRFTEVVQLIEAGRQTDRQQVARALQQIRTQTGMGFVRLAALTNEVPATLEN